MEKTELLLRTLVLSGILSVMIVILGAAIYWGRLYWFESASQWKRELERRKKEIERWIMEKKREEEGRPPFSYLDEDYEKFLKENRL